MFEQFLKLLPKRDSVVNLRAGKKAFFDRRIAYLLFASAGGGLLTAPVSAGELGGYWLTKNGGDIVEVGPCGSSARRMCGNIVWVSEGSSNSIGAKVLKGFSLVGKKSGGRWGKGKVVKTNGKSQKGKLRVGEETLKVSTCKGASCAHVTWTRPSDTLTAQAGLTGSSD